MKLGKYTIMLTAAALMAVSAQADNLLYIPASGNISDGANWFNTVTLGPGAPTSVDDITFNNGDVGQGNQNLNIDVNSSVRAVYSDWNAGGLVNTIGGPGVLTVNGGYNWGVGIANRAGAAGGGTLNVTGAVVINNPNGVTDVRTQNGANNVLEFTSSSTLSIDTTLVTLQWGGGNIQFNGTVNGGANLMIQSADARFGVGHDSSAWTGNILMNGTGAKLTLNSGTVGNAGNQLIGNYGANTIVLNGANVINGMGVSAWGALILDVNAGQDDFGAINEIQANGLTLDIADIGAGELWFDDSTGGAWGGALSIIGFQEDTIRFGTDASGLTGAQLALIAGDTYGLTETGYLTVIPEPATIGLLLIGGMGLFVNRRMRR